MCCTRRVTCGEQALLASQRTLRLEGLDLYLGKARHCLWLFSDFLLLARPTRDNKAFDLIYEQQITPHDGVAASRSKKGSHAFVLHANGRKKAFELETASELETQRWIDALNSAAPAAQ